MTKPESFIVKVFVCTHILTIQTQVFLFKANYGTVVPLGGFFISFLSIKENFLQDPWIDHIVHERVVDFLRVVISSLAYVH